MASRVGRVIPLALSGTVLVGFLINFKHFGLMFNRHFDYGAGMLYNNWGDVAPAGLIAKLYLHFSLFLLFLSGIVLFVRYKKISKALLLSISIGMLGFFLLRPVISIINHFFDYGSSGFLTIPTFTGQLIGNVNEEGQYNSLTLFQGYLGGVFLLLLLVLNLIFSLIRESNPAHKQQRQSRVMPPQYAQPIQVPVQQQGVSVSMTQELERLQQMYQSGTLTEDEFTAAKKRVLGN
jgi:hypothetical protein